MIAAPRSRGVRASLSTVLGVVSIGALALSCPPLGRASGVPAPVIAVFGGMVLGALVSSPAFSRGLAVWSKAGLKTGVALMGAQVAWSELLLLGPLVAAASGVIVATSLAACAAVGFAAGLPIVEALICACAVSICGASAAIAAASVLPGGTETRRTTALVVVGVNILSTLAMVAYPYLAARLGLSDRQAGVFLGFSIHDVAQVVAAGASVSPSAATAAALTKVSRVLWLGPALMAVALAARRIGKPGGAPASMGVAAPPGFIWGFAALLAARNLELLPSGLLAAISELSKFLLLAAACAIGAQVSPREFLRLRAPLATTLIAGTGMIGAIGLAASLLLAR
ncbi:putative sulfate exporter family transporter [Phenylobacterium sp. LH3H17]|uniref:YeiH family protein n=1 Tax=Phenylobacterium sp. LH3H17 TaxID=2903901 RepID=UPI0020CA0B2A|nr:putative sulfate exporter family transporter [Phenylobacterium sp. LH3H17]UTP38279.1 putative sulfate exporter family transporter [Phenylobacterium sp. LH3H17]